MSISIGLTLDEIAKLELNGSFARAAAILIAAMKHKVGLDVSDNMAELLHGLIGSSRIWILNKEVDGEVCYCCGKSIGRSKCKVVKMGYYSYGNPMCERCFNTFRICLKILRQYVCIAEWRTDSGKEVYRDGYYWIPHH